MLSVEEATTIMQQALPQGTIASKIDYNDLYVFQVFLNEVGEEGYDPFFSVNKETGEVRDFSIITDGNTKEIVELFLRAQGR